MKNEIKFEVRFFLKQDIKKFNKTSEELKKYLNSYKVLNGLPNSEEEVDLLVEKVIEAFPDKLSHFKVEKVYMI